MKKNIFGVALISAMAVTAGQNFNQSKNETQLSDLAMANVEALARSEATAECGNMTPVICKATCSRCGKVYETKEAPGPASNVKGNCSCGGTLKGNN